MEYTGVFPVFNNQFMFDIGSKGTPKKVKVADLESFSVSFSNGIETWTPMDTEGWQRGLMTAKSLKIEFKGKRNVGDEGNDFIAGLAYKTGADVTIPFEWTMVSGAKLAFKAIVDVTSAEGGDSTNVGSLEFTVNCDGKPTYTPAI
ncbi:hypothetical protein HMPREF9013_1296 [Bulleidia extructa W1219]|uniref:Phage major tail protein, TP901-1 family n=1 Tax=Bulleidia extructa W1219 TaxID=679192 RepID=D2MPI0_9FIRM|nr:hypothetical protein [Bulleidia extructa]EFC05592.1 hypothetical protein HMPREF9013_1296 [Bulleidia extructa W1219]